MLHRYVYNVTQWYRTVVHVCTGSIPRVLYVSLAHYGTFEAFGRFVNHVTLLERIGAVANHLKTKGAFTLNDSETCLRSWPLRSMNNTWNFLRNHLKVTPLTRLLSFNVNIYHKRYIVKRRHFCGMSIACFAAGLGRGPTEQVFEHVRGD